jgi:pyrrolidone-carboxylate peptidase
MHELVHVAQHGSQSWSVDRLKVSDPGDPAEREAESIASNPSLSGALAPVRARGHADPTLWRTWEPEKPGDCPARPPGVWIQKVVVDQEKAQSTTLQWNDGSVTASICSTGKGHCCVDERANPDGVAGTVSESRRVGSNLTPIGEDHTITDRLRVNNTWRFWNTFAPTRSIALHQHTTVTGTPLSHGCVRLPEETARAIFCGARQNVTRVEVRGFSRPDCDEPELQAEWRGDFAFAGATVKDGEKPDVARTIRENRTESRRILRESYGREPSESEIEQGAKGRMRIPRCGAQAAQPTTEESRAIPETGAGANVPSTSSELLVRTGLERFIPMIAGALEAARTLDGAQRSVHRVGRELWNAATAAARAGRADDRALYWARLALTRTIRQWEPRFRLSPTQRDNLIIGFDHASRGMETATFLARRAGKRLLISGFDPFGFELESYGLTRATNPSGAAALALDGRTISNGAVHGTVESVIFPVSYAAFDAGTVERFFGPFLRGPDHVDLIMTISMGAPDAGSRGTPGAGFEVEEWAGRRRGGGVTDDPGVRAVAGTPPGVGAGPEFIRGTLPSSARRALGRPSAIQAETEVVEIPAGSTTEVPRTSGPTAGSRAVAGSGAAFLSNEIFYRVGLLRLQSGATIPYGHLHVPFVSPNFADFASREAQTTRQVEQILTAMLADI